jgi:alanyl aminopeptidase
MSHLPAIRCTGSDQSTMSNRLPLVLILTAASCTGQPVEAPPPAAPPAPPPAAQAAQRPALPAPAPPPGLRLPRSATPVRYRATLTIVPAEGSLKGAIDIDLTLAEPSRVIWLHGKELAVEGASLVAGGKKIAARAVPGGEDFIGFALDQEAPAGPSRLHVDYHAGISDKDDRGVFKEQEGDGLYVFSQFESIDARRAFPCFDEPSSKVPWQLTLRVKEGDVALSNTPVVSESPAEGGMKTIQFAETRPIPSYLVAFAVGPFELLDAGKAGKKGTPIRIVVPRGQKAEAAYAAATTGPLLNQLEDFFGIPYPYEKLDIVAIPRLISFGAMENAGLITYDKSGMLAKPEEDTIAFRRSYADTITHEMAHQWFGNLVTTAFWDDIWLNEAFASWMEGKILMRWKPEWAYEASRVRRYGYAMQGDSLISARQIRQRIETNDDIQNAFDGITYTKGSAVIDMFESWVGPERFQKGVQRYLREHAFGNATAADFLAAVNAEAGRAVGPAFSTFLDQPGVPLIGAELKCDKGSKPRVELAQERYLPVGSKGAAAQTWQVPVCVRYPTGGKATAEACALLTERTASLELDKAASCPAWVMPNARSVGYYHVAYRPEALDRLLKGGGQQLSLVERLGVLNDLQALMQNGRLPAEAALARLPELTKDPSVHVLRAAVELLRAIRDPFIAAADRPSFARFIRATFGPRAREIGWKPKPAEDEQIRLLRPLLLELVADKGEDKALRAEAEAIASRWLADPRAVEGDIIDAALVVTARHGDKKLFDRIHEAARKTADQNQRRHLIEAMGAFQDPAIAKEALGLFLGREFDARDALLLLYPDERTADVTFAFLKQNFDAILARVADERRGDLPGLGRTFCDEPHRADVEGFFKDRVARLTGGPRNLAQVLERISLCNDLRATHQPGLTAFLKKY